MPGIGGVRVSNLRVEVTRTKASVVEAVTFDIPRGCVLGLVGESGSGKSTVGVALLGKARKGLRIASGRVEIDGMDILALDAKHLRSARGRLVSYVPQDPASGLNPALRIGSQLREALLVHRSSDAELDVEERVRELLREVALPDTADLLRKYPHQLSGGQQQRIGIAMAFAWRPKLVVLDEPTTGLDVTTQRTILETVRALSSSFGASALYVSHDLPVVGQIADETAVMYAGRIVERSDAITLFENPRHPYTQGLIAAAPSPDESAVLVGIEGRPPRPGAWPPGCTFADRCLKATIQCRTEQPVWTERDAGAGYRCWNPLTTWSEQVRTSRRTAEAHSDAAVGLRVNDLSASYGAVEVVHSVSLDIAPGTCTAIVGESGSGKTTLARCIVGLHSGCTGELTLGSQSLAVGGRRRTKEQRRSLQYVFQNPFASLNPRMTVAENIEEPLRYFTRLGGAELRQRVLNVLDEVALSSTFADRMPDQLSGGERQRVAVGRALVLEPDVLVCDEVTSALDVSVQALLVEQLRTLQERTGLSMLFITHNLAVVRSIADEVVVLSQGRVVEKGVTSQVLDEPQHAYTRQLLADLPRLGRRVDASALTAQLMTGAHS